MFYRIKEIKYKRNKTLNFLSFLARSGPHSCKSQLLNTKTKQCGVPEVKVAVKKNQTNFLYMKFSFMLLVQKVNAVVVGGNHRWQLNNYLYFWENDNDNMATHKSTIQLLETTSFYATIHPAPKLITASLRSSQSLMVSRGKILAILSNCLLEMLLLFARYIPPERLCFDQMFTSAYETEHADA